MLLGWWIWGRQRDGRAVDPAAGSGALLRLFRSGWGFDAIYAALLERPFAMIAGWLRHEPVDTPFRILATSVRLMHEQVRTIQTGFLRFYVLNMGLGTVFLVLMVLLLS